MNCISSFVRKQLGGWILTSAIVAPVAAVAAPPLPSSVAAQAATTSATIAPATLPTGGEITAGSASIHQSGNTTTITQQSEDVSLNWQSFNIGAASTVDFLQPNASAIAVNHITGTTGSVILGHLNANGQVYLLNPNGVLFGEGAQVNVGGLVASTLDAVSATPGSDTVSLSGSSNGSVINRGTLTAAPGGYVALVGNQVSNQGLIRAQLGSVALAGGTKVTLSFDGRQLVNVQVDRSALNALAQNGQLIVADGGRVWMTAGARDSLLASAVNNTGTVEAQTVESHGGTITLLGGMQAGTVNVGGTLDASAPRGGNGGSIETSGSQVRVADGATVTTAAPAGRDGTWVIDPQDFIIATSGGDITPATLNAELTSGNVVISSASGTHAGLGDVDVESSVAWSSANTLTLQAVNDIVFSSGVTLNGGSGALNLNASNSVLGSGATIVVGSLTATAGGSINLPSASNAISTLGPISAGGAVTIADSTALTVSGPVNAQSLALTTSSGALTLAGGTVLTAGSQSYSAPQIVLGADTSLQSTANGAIGFNGDVDGAHNLSITTGGPVTLAGLGNITPLTSLTVNAPASLGGNVTTTGAQTYAGALTLGGNLTLSGNGAILFDSTVDGSAALTVTSSGDVTFLGAIGGASPLSALNVTSNGGAIRQYAALSVLGPANFYTDNGGIILGTLDTGNLTVTSGATLNLGQGTVAGTLIASSDGAMNQNGALTVTGAASFTQNDLATGTSQDITLGSAGNNFQSTVTFASAAGSQINNLTLTNAASAPGALFLPASVGGNLSLDYPNASLTLPSVSVGGALTASAAGGITLDGNVTSGGGQSYDSATRLGADVTLSDTGGGTIQFGSTVDGPHALAVTTGGNVSFLAAVGGASPLASLAVNAPASLSANVTSSGAQTYAGAVTLTSNATLSSAGGPITFASTLDSAGVPYALTVNAGAGVLSFDAPVGALLPLSSLASTGSGAVLLSGNVTTAGSQFYAGSVLLNSNLILSAVSGAVQFAGTVDNASPAAETLTVNAGGPVQFLGAVGAGPDGPLGNLITSGSAFSAGALNLGGDLAVSTSSGDITQSGAFTVQGTTNLNAGSNAITLNNANNAFAGALSLVGDNVLLTNAVATVLGPTAVAGSLTVDSGSALTQTAPVSVAGPATFNSASGDAILTNAGNDFGGAVSLSANNASLTNSTTTVLGPTAVSGTLVVVSAGALTQSGPLTVVGSSAFNTGSGGLTLTNAGNDLTGTVSLTGGNVAVVNGTATVLATSTVSGSLTVLSNGALTQSGSLSVAGPSAFNVGTADLVLSNVGNDLAGALSLTGNNVVLTNATATVLAASAVSGSLVVNSNGALSESGPLSVSGPATFQVSGAGRDVLLAQSNLFQGGVTVQGVGIDNLVLTNTASAATPLALPAAVTGAVTLDYPNAALTLPPMAVGGALDVTAAGISQAGAVTVNGTSDFESGTAAITLGNPGNAFSGDITLTGGATQIAAGSALSLGTVNTGALTASSGAALNLGTGTIGGALTASANGALSESGALAVAGATSLTAGSNPITLTSGGNQFAGPVSVGSGGALALLNNGTLTLGAVSAGSVNIQTTTGNALLVAGPVTTSGSGDSLVLVSGGAFSNNAGAGALNAGAGNWLVWSQNPANDTLDGLLPNFKQYDATYGATGVLGTGNGLLYTYAPLITLSLHGSVTKTYDATAAATLGASNYTVNGAIDGDTVTLAPFSASYNSANAGTDKPVTTSGLAIATAANGSVPVYGYQLASATATADIGTISPATLTYVANPSSIWSGQTPAGLNGTVTGLVDGQTLAQATTGTLTWSTPASAMSPPGLYAISGGGLSAQNYVFAQASGNPTALTVKTGSAPSDAERTIASLQQQLGENYAPASAAAAAPELHTPDIKIIGEGVRLQ